MVINISIHIIYIVARITQVKMELMKPIVRTGISLGRARPVEELNAEQVHLARFRINERSNGTLVPASSLTPYSLYISIVHSNRQFVS